MSDKKINRAGKLTANIVYVPRKGAWVNGF